MAVQTRIQTRDEKNGSDYRTVTEREDYAIDLGQWVIVDRTFTPIDKNEQIALYNSQIISLQNQITALQAKIDALNALG